MKKPSRRQPRAKPIHCVPVRECSMERGRPARKRPGIGEGDQNAGETAALHPRVNPASHFHASIGAPRQV